MARETLSRDQIVTAALELMDAEGLEGMNMRALGKHLDSAPTAVYWHVGSRDSVSRGMGPTLGHRGPDLN